MTDLQSYVNDLGRRARRASRALAALDGNTKVAMLRQIARSLRERTPALLEANAKDVAAARAAALAPALVKRLELDAKKVESMAQGVEQIAAQVDPVGQVIEG